MPFVHDGEIHVWRLLLTDESTREICRREILSPEELARAERFHSMRDRHAFTATRTALRMLLGRYTGESPSALRLETGSFGKPALDERCNPRRLSFNVSHSGAYALLAFGVGVHVGVDVERVRSEKEVTEVASSVLQASEYERLMSLPPLERRLAFFRAWTRKEALVKALGYGLSMPLSELEVTFGPHEDARFVKSESALADPLQWRLHAIEMDDAHVAALAASLPHGELTLRTWSGGD